jgi:transposase
VLDEKVAELEAKLVKVQARVEKLLRKIFGESSEKTPSDKPEEGSKKDPPSDPAKKPKPPKKGHGPTEQPALEVKEETHLLDDSDTICPECDEGTLEAWKGQTEDSDDIDVIARKFLIRRNKCQKYRCTKCRHIETALPPKKLIPGGRYTPDVAIEIAVGKYGDHLPLERQVRIMKREGLNVTSQTLWDQVNALCTHLEPLRERLRQHVLTHPSIGMDETTWRMLTKSNNKKKWYVWGLCGPDSVYYRIEDTRSADIAKEILGDYSGRLMTDDFSGYNRISKHEDSNFDLEKCWAHARRKFFEAKELEPKRAQGVMDLINTLYRNERACDTDEKRAEIRKTKSCDVIEALRVWSTTTDGVLPESSFGKALSYMKNNFDELEKFIHHGMAGIDNNATERALRGVVIGRKNHYGSKSKRGADVAALMYGLIESAKLVGIDPRSYLRQAIDSALTGGYIPLPHEFDPLA